MIIAVDFDGTIVEHRYPNIGKERPFAISTLLKLQSEGHLLILWSVREGELLDEAVAFCRERGLEFYAVNSDDPDSESQSRKIVADLYIDDRNIGGLPDWGIIYTMIHSGISYNEYLEQINMPDCRDEKRTLWRKLFP